VSKNTYFGKAGDTAMGLSEFEVKRVIATLEKIALQQNLMTEFQKEQVAQLERLNENMELMIKLLREYPEEDNQVDGITYLKRALLPDTRKE